MNIKSIVIGIVIFIAGGLISSYLLKDYIQDLALGELVGTATLDEKDSSIQVVPDSVLKPKELLNPENKAKNIILLIGDGMSISQISAYRLINGGANSRISLDQFPVTGIVLTHSANGIVTDSASSATAYSTGKKTNNGALGLDEEKKNLENLTETLDKFGFVSSLLATSEITHATPAAFAAHVDLRWKTDEISLQMVNDSIVSTFLAGGRSFFLPEDKGGKRKDGIDLLDQVNSTHILLTNKEEMVNFDLSRKGKLFGLFSGEHLRNIETPDNHSTEPELAQMLDFALKRSEKFIDEGCDGFFIMAEGSQVDWAGHVNNIEYLKREMSDFDSAAEWALEYAKSKGDTLVVVTADHETGGLLIEPPAPTKYEGNEIKISFNTAVGRGTHTGVPVPIYAYGPGSENFTGTLDNTDVYRAILSALDLGDSRSSCIAN